METYGLGPIETKIKNSYPESSKLYCSITLNHCIANFSEWHVICIHVYKTYAITSVTSHQIEIKVSKGAKIRNYLSGIKMCSF